MDDLHTIRDDAEKTQRITANVDSRPMGKRELFAELARYPDPPEPFGDPFEIDVPIISAVYFLHNEGRIEYVGKANDLRKRIGGLNALRHHAIEHGDEISWIRFDDEDELAFVECFYIWFCRPGRNFGRSHQAFVRRIDARKTTK